MRIHSSIHRRGQDGYALLMVLVLTGVSSREEAEAARNPEPVAISEHLHKLVVG